MTCHPKQFVYRQGSRFEVRADGLFYSPEECEGKKNEDCSECRFCQWCSDSRCALCQKQRVREAGRDQEPATEEEP